MMTMNDFFSFQLIEYQSMDRVGTFIIISDRDLMFSWFYLEIDIFLLLLRTLSIQISTFNFYIILQELATLEIVWQLTDEWDKAWEKYKSGEFWAIETEEMEVTAQTLFRKLTRLSRELKEKGYSIFDEVIRKVILRKYFQVVDC